MPIPDISQGHKLPTDLPHPSDGPFAKQRDEAQAFRHKVAQDKINEADEAKRILPGTGPVDRKEPVQS